MVTHNSSERTGIRLRVSDVRAAVQLAAQATLGTARIVEGVHQSVWRTLGAPVGAEPGRTRGITGAVYRGIHGVTRLAAAGADRALAQLEPLFDTADAMAPEEPAREAVIAALNGVMGDRLEAAGNPLATRMALRTQARTGRRLAVLVHGLCMNDLQWGAAHGDALAAEGFTVARARFNTGLHIHRNGLEFAQALDALVEGWPEPVEEIAIVAHSMGGLVARSACAHAARLGWAWLPLQRSMVFLGTPHHGAPLERAGGWIDVLLGTTPYSAPFARLTQLRSAGITDLRHGQVGETRAEHVPLPHGVACYSVAATLAGKRSLLADRLVGDGLVPLRSALGDHDDSARNLGLAASSRWIAWRTGHMQLLHSAEVARQVAAWLGGRAG